jgi:hypothetical protein
MALSRYKFFDTIWNEDIKHTQKGMMSFNIADILKSEEDLYYKIPLEYRYRPDLIAKKFFGDPKLSWILIYCNGFNNSPEDFENDITIRVPNINKIMDLIG